METSAFPEPVLYYTALACCFIRDRKTETRAKSKRYVLSMVNAKDTGVKITWLVGLGPLTVFMNRKSISLIP